MKRFTLLSTSVLCLAIAVVLFVVSSASAILPPIGYIGLFTDATHFVGDPPMYLNPGNTICPAMYTGFPCWIWALPSVNGLQAAEFAVQYPATVINLATVKNPGITVELGTLTTGISIRCMCQNDWVWLYDLTLMAVGPFAHTKVDIIPHPGTLPVPAMQFANCLPGYPIEPFRYITPLYLCWSPDPGPIAVRRAMKSRTSKSRGPSLWGP